MQYYVQFIKIPIFNEAFFNKEHKLTRLNMISC